MPVNRRLPTTFGTATARRLGVHPRDLYRWRERGDIVELSRGVFRRADAPPASYPDLLAVSLRVPRGIVCCISAAAVHDLTDDLPPVVQIAVPKRSHSPRISYPPTQVFRFEEDAFELGLATVLAAPAELVRIYDAARTVVDLLRLRHRLGEPLAYAALRRLVAQPDARPALLLEYADRLKAYGPVRHALDVVNAA